MLALPPCPVLLQLLAHRGQVDDLGTSIHVLTDLRAGHAGSDLTWLVVLAGLVPAEGDVLVFRQPVQVGPLDIPAELFPVGLPEPEVAKDDVEDYPARPVRRGVTCAVPAPVAASGDITSPWSQVKKTCRMRGGRSWICFSVGVFEHSLE